MMISLFCVVSGILFTLYKHPMSLFSHRFLPHGTITEAGTKTAFSSRLCKLQLETTQWPVGAWDNMKREQDRDRKRRREVGEERPRPPWCLSPCWLLMSEAHLVSPYRTYHQAPTLRLLSRERERERALERLVEVGLEGRGRRNRRGWHRGCLCLSAPDRMVLTEHVRGLIPKTRLF